MKIETKLALKNISKNKKRTIFTIISVILCTFLLFTATLVISSIRNGIDESLTRNKKDYHFAIKNLSSEDFNKIKDKNYIETIDIRNNDNIYLKFTNVHNVCKYCNDIISTLNFTYQDVTENCKINEELLNMHGVMNITVVTSTGTDVIIYSRANLSYLIDVLILLVLIIFSALFIIILYNAFLITIDERRKEYAILNSIGATKKQIVSMIFKETEVIGAVGIILGGLLSIVGTNAILKVMNNILLDTIYNFEISIKPLYLILLIVVVIINIFISAIIPSIEASNTSVVQRIRNNNHIKSNKKSGIIESALSIEGRIAVKNLKRNKSKYRVIMLLLVICIVAYIVTETYIKYEEKTSDLVDNYDVDALINFKSNLNIDYETILENYAKETGDDVEYIKYSVHFWPVIAEPSEAILYGFLPTKIGNETIEYEYVNLIVLDNETYNNYLNDLDEESADCIIYNNVLSDSEVYDLADSRIYEFYKVFDENYNLNLKIIDVFESDTDITSDESNPELEYKIVDANSLSGKVVYTDEYLDFFKETSVSPILSIFINEDKYNLIKENIQNYIDSNEITSLSNFDIDIDINNNYLEFVKIRCKNIISFANYMEEVIEEQNLDIYTAFFPLENQENIIYLNMLEFLLKIVVSTIIVIGLVSLTNILNASLNERKYEFEILNSIGATNKNINKILIYECVIVFIKALIISLIISIPIIYKIIKYMKKIVVLQKTLIPYTNIIIFILTLFIISLIITVISGKTIKRED